MPTTELLRPVDILSSSDPLHETDRPARISIRHPVSTVGSVDAAWWPRSLDLSDELPPLMDALWSVGRDIARITYNLDAWDPAPRRMQIKGHAVRLGGFTTSDPLTVRLSDTWGRERIDMLVIAPDTDPATAERALRLAGHAANLDSAHDLLTKAANPS